MILIEKMDLQIFNQSSNLEKIQILFLSNFPKNKKMEFQIIFFLKSTNKNFFFYDDECKIEGLVVLRIFLYPKKKCSRFKKILRH